jgi:DNA repair protein RecO (recombination protein O)
VALEKTEALVLRSIKFGETSRIITFLSRDSGRLKAIGKGVRSARPRFGSALEPFARTELIYYRKAGRDLHLISQADLIEGFLKLSDDLLTYAFGCAILEFMERVVPEEEGVPTVYDAAIQVLGLLQGASREGLPHLLRAFQMQTMERLGHGPELYLCTSCGQEAGGSTTLSPLSGGVLCAACSRNSPGSLFRTSAEALEILRSYRSEPLEAAGLRTLDPRVRADVGKIIESFLSTQFDSYRGLKSLRLAATLRSAGRGTPGEAASRSG